jgi:hypothetical protein
MVFGRLLPDKTKAHRHSPKKNDRKKIRFHDLRHSDMMFDGEYFQPSGCGEQGGYGSGDE